MEWRSCQEKRIRAGCGPQVPSALGCKKLLEDWCYAVPSCAMQLQLNPVLLKGLSRLAHIDEAAEEVES
eukprot:4827979-Amphidinium_carterae.1